jgi:hypothetical protein
MEWAQVDQGKEALEGVVDVDITSINVELEASPKEVAAGGYTLQLNTFKPGLIHDPRFRVFWQEELRAPHWVMTTLDKGYEMPLSGWPERYEERNNKTARENMQIVRGIVAEMIQLGVVQVVKEKPLVVSPLGLVTKTLDDGSLKHRLVYDASRHLNKYVQVPHVRLSHLEKALEITQKGDFQVIFDLKSAYYHIKIVPEQHCLLGAAFENSDGTKVYFQYTHLPFGVASAVHAITKIWKPVSQYLNTRGIRNTVYIDDGRLLAQSATEAESNRVLAYDVISKAGWAIEVDKSDGHNDASNEKKYLGFLINSQSLTVKATKEKIQKVSKMIQDTLRMSKIPIKRLASLMGNIIALEPSHGMLARVTTRSGYLAMAEHVETEGWRGSVVRNESITNELEFLLAQIALRNGNPIKNKQLEFRLEALIPNPVAKRLKIPNHVPGSEIVVSDSSEFKTFVYNLTDGGRVELTGTFTPEQRAWSSGARELIAVFWTLRQWQLQGVRNKNVYWMTDAENVVFFLKKGSRKPDIQRIIFEIVMLAGDLQVQIEPIHLLREDPRIQLADEGSKTPNTDNWSIDVFTVLELKSQFDIDIDLFADAKNLVCENFCSLYFEEGTTAIDAFSTDWSTHGFIWVCPPVTDLIRVHTKIMRSACRGLLILPVWRTASFYTFFFINNDQPKPPFKLVKMWTPFIIQHENAKNTALFGQVPFNFAVLYFQIQPQQSDQQ